MTTVAMADATGPDSKYIPLSFAKAAGYRTGGADIVWTGQEIARFKTTSLISIDQSPALSEFGMGLADVADIEPGAGTIESFLLAADNRSKLGKRNGLYCSFDNLPVNVSAILGSKVQLSTVDFWVANWNFSQAEASQFVGEYKLIINGNEVTINVVAVQWASPTSNPETIVPGSNPPMSLKTANVDLSETSPEWFPFVPVKPPPVQTTKTGIVVTNELETFKVISKNSGTTWEKA